MRRRASEALGLALLLWSCGGVEAPDAGTVVPLDAAGPPDAGPAAICGNGRFEPGERCDDGDLEVGDGCDATCRLEPFCGDGVVDEGEVCDDGNGAFSDGCAPSCASDETCGNGVLDSTTREVCDGEPGCTAGCGWLTCGDGVVEGGEICDDGGSAPFDGCGADCRPERTFSVSAFEIAPAERGCDSSGDGLVDNRFAQWLRSARVPLSSFVNETLLIDLFVLVGLHGLDDPAARDDPHVLVSISDGWDTNQDVDDNALEGAAVYALSESMPFANRPVHVLPGSIAEGMIEAGPGSLTVRTRSGPPQLDPCDLEVRAFDLRLERASLRGRIAGIGGAPIYLEDATLCGALPIRALAAEPNPFAGLLTFRPCDSESEVTLVDLLLGGGDLAGVRLAPVTPDVDLDRDGLERFELDAIGAPGCQPVVTACFDGDGTRYDGHDCVLRPEIGDAVSLAFELSATIASLAGIVDDEEACALTR